MGEGEEFDIGLAEIEVAEFAAEHIISSDVEKFADLNKFSEAWFCYTSQPTASLCRGDPHLFGEFFTSKVIIFQQIAQSNMKHEILKLAFSLRM